MDTGLKRPASLKNGLLPAGCNPLFICVNLVDEN